MRQFAVVFPVILLLVVQSCSSKSGSAPMPSVGADRPIAAGPIAHPPDLNAWLIDHPRIAGAIRWQKRAASVSDRYAPPAESCTTAWRDWPRSWKDELNRAYLEACARLGEGGLQAPSNASGLTDAPLNLHPARETDAETAMQWVSPSYMWKLYLAHVAFSLAQELAHRLPWSISEYDEESLRYLFDSTKMAWNMGEYFMMGTAAERVPAGRADNLPKTAFAPPAWTHRFLVQARLLGANRIETIGTVLDWMRDNLTHFYGNNSFGTYDAIWHYRGYPPLSRIAGGTVDARYPQLGRKNWTAGCHGSVGFLTAVLRVVNIPVQPVWICEHELAYFMSEKLYLDHGDDPYHDMVRILRVPVLSMLIDEATYGAWFTTNTTINITDNRNPVCRNVGHRISELVADAGLSLSYSDPLRFRSEPKY